MNKKIELLSPAGSIKSFEAAIKAGADAIYMGCENFNARIMAENFNVEEYKNCILKAHILNVKVYLTLNTLLFDDEFSDALNLVLELYSAGLDAVIVQDIGLAMKIHELIPDLALHASTQMSVYCIEQVEFLKSLGFKRVVLARELSIDEIEHITENTDIEIEVFVHGALCVCFSGQCLMSALIGKRSANRGRCAQPCRMRYTLLDEKNKEIISKAYLLSKKDTIGIKYIKRLNDIGVTSIKIEGRNKSEQYVYLTTSIYKKYIDNNSLNISDYDAKNLMQIFNRGAMSTNYLDGVKKEDSITLKSPKNMGLFLGKVILQNKKFIKVKLKEDIALHDGIEIYGNDGVVASTIVTCIKDEFHNIKNEGILKENYAFIGDIKKKVSVGDEIYKTSSYKLNDSINSNINNNDNYKKRVINLDIILKLNETPIYRFYLNKNKYEIKVPYKIEKSINKSISIDDIKSNLSKNKELLFEFNINFYDIDENIYIPVSILNELRRNLDKKLENCFLIKRDIKNIDIKKALKLNYEEFDKTKLTNLNDSLFIYKYNQKIDYKKVYKDSFNKDHIDIIYISITDIYNDINKLKNIVTKYFDSKIYLYIPNVVFEKQDKFIRENIEEILKCKISGFLLGSYSYIELINSYKDKYNISLIADHTLNITNSYCASFIKSLGFSEVTPSIEINSNDIINISNIIPVDILCDKVTVMTSRYCVLCSFLRDKKLDKCSRPCINKNYKLKDEYGYIYDIVTDNIDCISKLVRTIRNIDEDEINSANIKSIRRVIL